MSADLLRRAAKEMRERADAAMPGGWYAGTSNWVVAVVGDMADEFDVAKAHEAADAEHIASWHPAVALSVADWLAFMADFIDASSLGMAGTSGDHAIAVARAYLGEQASA